MKIDPFNYIDGRSQLMISLVNPLTAESTNPTLRFLPV